MRNPWLDIPLADYERHMALPHVGQAQLLSKLFEETLRRYRPRTLALLGCAGGNGLEHVAAAGVQRVVGVDINEDYIACARARFGDRIAGLELFVGDMETDEFDFLPVELAYAGLLFEYVDVRRTLARIHSMLRPGGILVAVLQLPSEAASVTPSQFRSLESLSSLMRLVAPEDFQRHALASGFDPISARIEEVKGGKQFLLQTLRAAADSDRFESVAIGESAADPTST